MTQPTLKSRTIFCRDNLEVMRGVNSDSIDLIYLDPPFNKGRYFHAPIGTTAEGAAFSDIWADSDVKDEWHNEINDRHPVLYKYLDAVEGTSSRSAKNYLVYMAVRLLEIHRILKETGSVYFHCDPTASHYLKLLMDAVFGHGRYINEIAWCYTGPSGARKSYPKKKDIIFWYAKGEQWAFNRDAIRIPYKELHTDKGKAAAIWGAEGKLQDEETRKKYVKRGKIPEDYWLDIPSGGHISPHERTGYPTQKPLLLLERIIKASSNEGDVVLDPFCGCATTCVAAEKWGRHWVGIDVSAKAFELVKKRLNQLRESQRNDAAFASLLSSGELIFREDIPRRTDLPYKKAPTKNDKQWLYGRQNGTCGGCGTRFEIQHLTIDHIIPQASGGSHEIDNLQLLCGSCNSIKGDRPMEYLRNRIKLLYR